MIETVITQRRHAARYRQIVRVLLSHGLGGLLAPLRAGSWLSGDDVGPTDLVDDSHPKTRRRARHLRQALEELGPTFIKLGQILSTRSDILPEPYIRELGRLQNNVGHQPFADVRERVEEELGEPLETLFASFDEEPIAAASIGQVHGATLHDGSQVVVKVQRRDVEHLVSRDLSILTDMSRVAEGRSGAMRRIGVIRLVSEFGWTIRAELDYRKEGRSADRLRAALREVPGIRIPHVYWQRTTTRVLTMERVEGIRIDHVDELRAAGFHVPSLVERIVESLVVEILDAGFFHADPHPGNMVVCPDGAVGIYDFGLIGMLDDRLRERLLMLVLAAMNRDAGRVADELVQLGVVASDLDRTALERDVSHLMTEYLGTPLESLPIAVIISDGMAMLRAHQLRMPPELAMLAKTASMMESLARKLDPTINVIEVVQPTVRRSVRRLYSVSYLKEQMRAQPLELLLLGASLPSRLQRFFTRLDRNELAFKVKYDDLPTVLHALDAMVNRLALVIITASGFVGGTVLYQAVQPELFGFPGVLFLLGFAMLLWTAGLVLWRIWRSGRA